MLSPKSSLMRPLNPVRSERFRKSTHEKDIFGGLGRGV